MNKTVVAMDDLTCEAVNINNAISALEIYAFAIGSDPTSISLDDFNGLLGLINAIKTQSESHSENLINFKS